MTAVFHLNNKGIDLGSQWFISRISQLRGKNVWNKTVYAIPNLGLRLLVGIYWFQILREFVWFCNKSISLLLWKGVYKDTTYSNLEDKPYHIPFYTLAVMGISKNTVGDEICCTLKLRKLQQNPVPLKSN